MKKAVVILIILLLVGAYLVKTYNDLNLKDKDDFKTFTRVYFGWIYSVFKNIRDVTGYVTQKDWLPKNVSSDNSSSE